MPHQGRTEVFIKLTWLNLVVSSPLWPPRIRRHLLRIVGVKVGRSSVLNNQLFLSGTSLEVGHGTLINVGCTFDCAALVSIKNNVAIGPRVIFLTSDHLEGPPQRRAGPHLRSKIEIGDGAWVGAGSVILPGVVVGAGSIVGAGSVVTRDVPPDVVVAGVPARILRGTVSETDEIRH